MIHIRLHRAPAYIALASAAAILPVLMGCQPQTIVARVNDKPVSEQDFIDGVQKVKQTSFQGQNQAMDAGGITLVNSIQSILIDQCAAEPSLKAVPSEDVVLSYFTQLQRKDLNVANQLKAHVVEKEDILKQIKTFLEELAIGTDAAKPSEEELQAAYKKHVADHTLDFPTLYTLKVLVVGTRDAAAKILDGLKKNGDFRVAAEGLGATPEQVEAMIRPTIYSAEQLRTQLPAAAVSALDALTPNQFTNEPIEFTTQANPSNPQAPPPSTRYMLAQLVEKNPGSTPKLEDMRSQVSQMALQEKYPQWSVHAAVRVAEFTEKSNIQIMLDRYKPLLTTVILATAKRTAAMASGEAGGPGSMPGGSSPGGASPGAPPATGARP